jgi:hypothetical protein
MKIIRNLHYALAFFLAWGLAGPSFAQMELLTELSAKYHDYHTRTIQEKIFVHTDKPFYLAGEILWCKLYGVEGSYHTPLDLSRVAYIELLNKEDKPVLQGKVLLEKGEGSGSFYLPPTLNSGNYRFRAYTNWMKNLGPDGYFEETLTIVNPFKGTAIRMPADSGGTAAKSPAGAEEGSPYHIGFFPEGGNLVQGIPSKIAFEMTDAVGRGANGKGWVLNEKGDTLTGFQPLPSGLGHFFLTPDPGSVYRAVVIFPDGRNLVKELPAAEDRGYVLQVTEPEKGKLQVSVHASPGLPPGDVTLFVESGHSMELVGKAGLVNDEARFLLDKSRLGEGVNRMTLFNALGQPVRERLYGIYPRKQLILTAVTDRREYGIRKKVNLSLSAAAGEGPPLSSASLSMAVYRLDSLQPPPPTDIFTYLWFGSDLKGRIESPESYLAVTGPEAGEALDNLMLTHGWRRFRWEGKEGREAKEGKEGTTPFSPAAPVFPPERRGQIITGRLTDTRTGVPAPGIITFLSVPGIQFEFASALTDSAGKFLFDIKDFYGAGGILVQTNTPKDSIYKIEIFNPYSELYNKARLPVFSLAEPQQKTFLEHSIGMQVQNVYSADSLNRFIPPALDSMRFYGRPEYAYKLDDYTRFTTMEEVLREYVREINVNRLHGHLHVVMLNEPDRQFFDDNNTLVMLDGIPVPDDRIFSYDPLKAAKLEIVPRQYVAGPSVFSGIASFTTYKGDYTGLEMDRRSLLIDYDGLQLQREFYSPLYETERQAASRLPDFRNLLYWSPGIHMDGQGKKELSFYTSDVPGKYLVVLQGLTADGRAGVKYLDFEVK